MILNASQEGYEVDFDADISQGESKTPIEYSQTVLVDYTTGTEQLDERR